eukprot:TRINITY_DN68140_c5_g4_i1.p1 TRINITY_DN68140_c5_g4~~TRINITY_DN68140_c5_g4_i1.p1  ORF type:complete len:428 (-),score=26.81 TRINITY_DN68140_c5_g4_i1:856-2100(-)
MKKRKGYSVEVCPTDLKASFAALPTPALHRPFLGDEGDPRVAALMNVAVDLSTDDMEPATPVQAVEKSIVREINRIKALEAGKGTLAENERVYHARRNHVEKIANLTNVVTFDDAYNRLFGAQPNQKGGASTASSSSSGEGGLMAPLEPVCERLRSISDDGRRRNSQVVPKKEQNYVTDFSSKSQKGVPAVAPDIGTTVADDETVLTVALYHPERNLKMEEWKVLGSQKLTELRDVLYCISDAKGALAEEHRNSALFFINGTFYVDFRNLDCIDYSEPLRGWAPNVSNKFQNAPLKSMQDHTFNDLSIKIGEQCCYMHQGNCIHHLVFTCLRIRHPMEDSKFLSEYPKRIWMAKYKKRKCSVCDIVPAKRVTFNDCLCCENPTFFCEQCYHKLHFTKDSKILYDNFELYPYWHE